jgi:hypothetical protein
MSKLIKLNKTRINFDLLNSLIIIMNKKLEQNEEIKHDADLLRSKIHNLFLDSINEFSDNPVFYETYSNFLQLSKFLNQELKIIELRTIIVRQLKLPNWDNEKLIFEKLAKAILNLVNSNLIYFNIIEDKSEKKKILSKCLLELRNIVKKAEENFSKTDYFLKLNNSLNEIEELKKNFSD